MDFMGDQAQFWDPTPINFLISLHQEGHIPQVYNFVISKFSKQKFSELD